ncbi:MAG: hybrid sensor histidine kinase/response regulator [Verrucomicrobia bacterium]|nr:hybrid sensor histidine kinase/response regulator [Verrucomicrobiota bacterium]
MDSSAAAVPTSLHGRRVLVVDDDRLNLRILAGILQSQGYVLADAATGEQALELLDSFKPDLVLLDVMMPGIDGFETCRRLKARLGDQAPPVIFITARREVDDVVEGLGAGAVDYLPKPFKAKEVQARIRAHLQNRLLVEQQQQLVDQLSRANAAKNRFLGMAAHDLRNPLASVRGLAEFLQDGALGPVTPEQSEVVRTILEASQSMLSLVNDLLDVATIESGVLKLNLGPCDLARLAGECVAMVNIEADKKRTRVELEVSGDAVELRLDAAKIRQVIDNLLSNAVKFSPPGSNIRALVKCDEAAGTGSFAVRDQGPGIPEGERDKLFKDFSRLSNRPTAGEKSTGLGLAICRKIVDAHHGMISAENLPSGGCEFRFFVPSQP